MQGEDATKDNPEIALDPVLFAQWSCSHMVLSVPEEEDLKRTLTEEQRKRYNISAHENSLCAAENVLMRALGVCLFVRNNLEPGYYNAFVEEFLKQVEARMASMGPDGATNNLAKVLDQYILDMRAETPWAFSNTYLKRVYPYTSNAQDMFLHGIPVKHAMLYAMDHYNMAFVNYNHLLQDSGAR